MILQALVSCYEALANKGEIPHSGWIPANISYALEIDANGALLNILPLKTPSADNKKMIPREIQLPAPVKRSSGIAANFLWDNSIYLLGFDSKGDENRARSCYVATAKLHSELLKNAECQFAKAITSFFLSWNPENTKTNEAICEIADELAKGANLTFMYEGCYPSEDKELCEVWQSYYNGEEAGVKMRCLVTGDEVIPAATHPAVKGIRGAQSSGAALVSFNAQAYSSFCREQNLNAPVGKYAAFAYTAALNYLISQKDDDGRFRSKLIGDTTVLFWAEDVQKQYQDVFTALLDGDSDENVSGNDLSVLVKAISEGTNVDWDGLPVKPENHFYILGIAPNAARLSVRFFLQDSFGNIVKHIKEHFDRLDIVTDNRSKWKTIPLWVLLQETVNKNSRDKAPSPQMAGDTLRAILTGGQYPATLYQQTQLRIRAERDITRGRAAIIKAYLLRNLNDNKNKEALTVKLNEETDYQPYIMGRLFSVLEAIQERANPGLNTTIKDKYFTSACTTPAVVFPSLLNLAQKHLRKMDSGASIYFSKQLGELTSVITESYPAHLTLSDQGIFQLGYYHQTQKRYEKKSVKPVTEED